MLNDNSMLKVKRGYLNEDFRYFHLKDNKNMEFELHYHDFDKIIIFILQQQKKTKVINILYIEQYTGSLRIHS